MAKVYYMQRENGSIVQTTNPEAWSDLAKLPANKGKVLYREQSILYLREILHDTPTIYGIVRSVSASGMSRRIDLCVFKNDAPTWVSWHAATALGWKVSDKGGVIVHGCGMDMVFHFATSMLSACGLDYLEFRVETL